MPEIQGQLPQPETADRVQALAAWRELRGRLRPALLDELRRVRAREDAESVIRRYEIELQLGELHDYGHRLDRRLEALDPVPPGVLRTPMFDDLEGQDGSWVRATTRLFYTPESEYFAHGPVIAFFAAALAERLLAPEERVLSILSAQFKEQVSCELALVARDTSRPGPAQAGRTAFRAAFETRSGRTLEVSGSQLRDRPIGDRAGTHGLAQALLSPGCSYDPRAEAHDFALDPGALAAFEDLPTGLPAAVYTVCELLATSTVLTRLQDGSTQLMTRFGKLPVLQNLAELGAGWHFQVIQDRNRRRTQAGMSYIPVKHRLLPLQPDFGEGAMVEIPGGFADRLAR